jgi:hypothetical protein
MTACQRLLCLVIAFYAAGATAACGDDSTPTSPTTTTTTTTTAAAEASISEAFVSSVPVNGSRFYAFEVGAYGTVNVTLDRVGGGGVPTSVWVGVGLGVPDGTDCSTTTSLNTQAGSGPHISTTLDVGTYCARIYDIGNLAAAAPFAVTIAHP